MSDFESHLNRWQSAGLLDAEAAGRIRAYESEQKKPAGLRDRDPQRQVFVDGVGWQGIVALILGAILLACGVALFVSAHWDKIGPGARLAVVLAMVSVFHLGGGFAHLGGGFARDRFHGLSTALHAVGTISTGAAIALVGQIFNIQEHWPAAVLMWALAALAGWILLRDEAQQTLALLLVPAWMVSELAFYADGHIGEAVYIGRFLFVWGVLYTTVFLGSKRKVMPWILFAVGAAATMAGINVMLPGGTWLRDQTFSNAYTGLCVWASIAALPLCYSLTRLRKSSIPVTVAISYSIALPWCYQNWSEHYDYGNGYTGFYNRTGSNLIAYVLLAAFAIFIIWWGFRLSSKVLVGLGIVYFATTPNRFVLSNVFSESIRTMIAQGMVAASAIFVIWWGVRLASKILVNLGIIGFAITVGWFYFSDIFDKLDRSLGLICLGILFLAGGWALEKTRRGLVANMGAAAAKEAL